MTASITYLVLLAADESDQARHLALPEEADAMVLVLEHHLLESAFSVDGDRKEKQRSIDFLNKNSRQHGRNTFRVALSKRLRRRGVDFHIAIFGGIEMRLRN